MGGVGNRRMMLRGSGTQQRAVARRTRQQRAYETNKRWPRKEISGLHMKTPAPTVRRRLERHIERHANPIGWRLPVAESQMMREMRCAKSELAGCGKGGPLGRACAEVLCAKAGSTGTMPSEGVALTASSSSERGGSKTTLANPGALGLGRQQHVEETSGTCVSSSSSSAGQQPGDTSSMPLGTPNAPGTGAFTPNTSIRSIATSRVTPM